MNLNVPQVFEQSDTVSMLVQYMNTERCNETSMHTKAVDSSHNWRRTPVRAYFFLCLAYSGLVYAAGRKKKNEKQHTEPSFIFGPL